MLNPSGVWARGGEGVPGVGLGPGLVASTHPAPVLQTSTAAMASTGQIPTQRVVVQDSEVLLRQAHEAYRLGNYQEALQLCQPVRNPNSLVVTGIGLLHLEDNFSAVSFTGILCQPQPHRHSLACRSCILSAQEL